MRNAQIVNRVANQIAIMRADWESGYAAIDPTDFVAAARDELEDSYPDFVGTTEDSEACLAENVTDLLWSGDLTGTAEIAEYIVAELIAE